MGRHAEKVRRPSGLIKLPSEVGGSSEPVFYGDASLGPELEGRGHLKAATKGIPSSQSFHHRVLSLASK